MAQLTQSLTVRARPLLKRFRVILRGDHFVAREGTQASGFYVVRTVLAENETLAGKLALFDFMAELRIAESLEPQFLRSGSLAVEEARPLGDGEEDVASDLILYPLV
ncbi:MAG: hypothetical protein ACM35H_15560 [Bacteroidota bacterium]